MQSFEHFGPSASLVGILSGAADPAQPLLLLPNAGLVPRAGPFRLHVEIAQRLAARGVRTFRFDLPGVGEAPTSAGLDARATTQAALDHLAARGIAQRFVVGGICSAADRGWAAAVDDTRVVGVLMLDGVAYGGPWFQRARIAGVLARPPREWFGVLRRRAVALGGDGGEPVSADFRDWPSIEAARVQIATLLARDVRLLCIYTRGVADYFRDPRQFAWSFGAGAANDPRVRFEYWRDCDHTFYARFARERLLATLEEWYADAFG